MIAKLSTAMIAPLHTALAEMIERQDAEQAERERSVLDAAEAVNADTNTPAANEAAGRDTD
jgi:hypothetical protein